ncbi:MAG: hypothetical protein EAZ51_00030 [Sphingobacteriales bacterium]|nr:MAG: hypothetical protein EAZ51_00030 [Sphingobacteriales bacterium]
MNTAILDTEVQAFIFKNLHTKPADIALKKTAFAAVSNIELAQQIDGRKRSEKKLPLWFSTSGIYYPEKINIEQSSSQITAAYKATLIQGQHVLDASGGFGVDAFYFAQQAKTVTHCELNASLSAIANHNLHVLETKNITFFAGDSLQFIKKNNPKIDTLFIDPSRRNNAGKVFKFIDCEPNLPQNLNLYLQKADRIIIKAAPMLDITFGLNELKHVSAVHVLSVKNECKELLYIIDKGFTGVPDVVCALLLNHKPAVIVSAK